MLRQPTIPHLPSSVDLRVLRRIADLKRWAELHEERRYEEWNINLTKDESPFYELARKLSKLYRIGNECPDDQMKVTFNPAKEIMRYRRSGDKLLYLDTNEARQMRVLVKYPSLAQMIRNGLQYSMMEKGSKVLNRYREPFSDKRWMYSWVEQFWIVLYAYAVSAREASRLVRALDGQSMRKLSARHIKNQIVPVIRFWSDYFEYLPHYLAYLDMIGWVINNDPELSKLDQQQNQEDLAGTRHEKALNLGNNKMIMISDKNQRKLGGGLIFKRCPGFPRR